MGGALPASDTLLGPYFFADPEGTYDPTFWDWALFAGTFGLFAMGFMAAMKWIPFIPMTELKEKK